MCMYITSAHGHELSSGRVLTHIIMYYYAPWAECAYVGF